MSIVPAPRCLIKVNGESVAPIECSVHLSIHQGADTFEAKLPLLPALGLDAAFWSNTVPIPIEIDGTNDVNTASYSPLLIGQADRVQVILHESAVAIRDGRDKTAALLDTKTTQQWVNQTDQQVITSLAQQAGLTVQFRAQPISAGLDMDADYYNELSDQDSAWNVVVALAKKAGCIAFVKGTTLYVQPIDAAPPNGYFVLQYAQPTPQQLAQANVPMIALEHNLALAKTTTVTLQSWQHQQGQAITSSFQSIGKDANSAPLVYTHREANLTKQQQDRIAAAHLKAVLNHEREVTANNTPGDVTAIPGVMGLTLKGSGTDFDQNYVFAEAMHRFSNDGGYMMDLTAHSQDASRGEPTQLQ
jgi:phage protein D